MRVSNEFCKRFDLNCPVIQAPLAGGGDTPELVAAVSNAGGIGFIGAAYLNGAQIAHAGEQVRAKTKRPFGVNLFAPMPAPGPVENITGAVERVAPFYAEMKLPRPATLPPVTSDFDSQLAAALDSGASAFSFTFGMLPPHVVRAVKSRAVFLMGTATTVQEAIELERSGVDAIIAQGSEAGGHRGTFATDFGSGMIGSISLVPQIVDAVRVPVFASGGIMDGRGIVAALALGASAVQLGTAFLTCNESGISDAYREAILTAHEDQTRITRAFSGRPARGIENRFMKEVESAGGTAILPFPLQNALTRPLRTAANKQGRAEFLSLWAGQGVRMARRQSASELLQRLSSEIDQTLDRLNSSRE